MKLKKITIITIFALIFVVINLVFDYQTMAGNTLSDAQKVVTNEYLKEKLVDEVQLYIDKKAKNSKVDARTLVLVCQKNNMDIIFVLAQAQIESHFGTKGKAKKTNSIFNVGTYDDGKVVYTYKHPNQSIEPFIKLLKTQYLINKDVNQLLKNNGYRNIRGERFATSPVYEQKLRNLMNDINDNTFIDNYQDFMVFNSKQTHMSKYIK